MDGAWEWIGAVVVAIVAYLIGSARSRQVIALAQHDFKIKVKKDDKGKYTSETDIKSKKVKGSDLVEWKIQDEGSNKLPEGSIVFLRFPGGSPLDPTEPNDNKTRTITAKVLRDQELRDYDYKVFYKVDDEEHPLEDPELIIEGDQMVVHV